MEAVVVNEQEMRSCSDCNGDDVEWGYSYTGCCFGGESSSWSVCGNVLLVLMVFVRFVDVKTVGSRRVQILVLPSVVV